MASDWGERLLVVGAGLIGTSIGLALRESGVDVQLADPDGGRLRLAESLGAGRARASDDEPVDLVVVAAPPSLVGHLCIQALTAHPTAVVTHVCSVQALPQGEVEASSATLDRFVGGHPIAGRELSGPAHATAALFRDRPWIVCPTGVTSPAAAEAVAGLASACGAVPVQLDAQQHDELFARLSHVPQLVASALAAALRDVSRDGVALAGPGIRDTTRLADSDPGLWSEIAVANAGPVAEGLRAVAVPLLAVAESLEGNGGGAAAAVEAILVAGRDGRAMLPGKHGGRPAELQTLEVVIPDEPGALASLLGAVAGNGVNLEDLRVDHAPGQPIGTAELVVQPAAAAALENALRAAGWTVSGGPATPL
jgi:prephenate dehydrogenase